MKRGVTQEALAPAVGISLTTLGSIERGTAAKVPIQYWTNLSLALVRSTQGDHGDRFYLIESGKVEVLEDGGFRRAESEGESFGEIALLRDTPRTATVRATRGTKLLVLERDHFSSAVAGHPRKHEAAGSVISERLG